MSQRERTCNFKRNNKTNITVSHNKIITLINTFRATKLIFQKMNLQIYKNHKTKLFVLSDLINYCKKDSELSLVESRIPEIGLTESKLMRNTMHLFI